MTQKAVKIITNESYRKPPRKNHPTNKTDVYHFDDIWSLDILGLKDYGPENNRGFRYVLVVIDNFSKFSWTVPFKNKNDQTVKDSYEHILITSKRKPKLFATDRGKDFHNDFLKNS